MEWLVGDEKEQRWGVEHTDICDCGSNSDFNAGVALLGQLTLEELVEFGVENTVGDELASLGDGALSGGHDCGSGANLCAISDWKWE
jgi:hypothetical protein